MEHHAPGRRAPDRRNKEETGRRDDRTGSIPTRPAQPADDWPTRCAQRLLDAVSDAGRLNKRINLNVWKREFAALAREVDDERPDRARARVDEVLGWYCGHVGGPGVPEAFCGRSFREKFDRIVAAMERRPIDRRDADPGTDRDESLPWTPPKREYVQPRPNPYDDPPG